ncbi:hypothetical protein DL96DRAFT_1704559 [Flagelloscypha sp. PMI_526]|nr:hypothetical protein DL96DRAFT_1704559 [Flagelloscypha sp. PMI_526]
MSLFILLSAFSLLCQGASIKFGAVESRDTAVANVTSSTLVNLESRDEVVTCYNKGTKIDRKYAITAIETFCGEVMGRHFNNDELFEKRYKFGNEVTQHMLISLKPINNCGGFTVDDNCGRLLRLPIDKCNTKGENGKQGGYETDPCGEWRADPGTWQTDCTGCFNIFYKELSRPCFSLPDVAAEACLGAAAVNAQKACHDNGACCPGSGLGREHDNCEIPYDDY